MLKSETYYQTLMKGLQDLKERNVGCDLTLSSKDGASFTVHRIIMAAASSYFMLKLDNEISSGQIHVLKNIDGPCLEALVHFAYTGELDFGSISKAAMWPLLSACTELQMTDALSLCHDYMAGNIAPPKPTRASGRRAASSHPSVKMEIDLPGVKQEGLGEFSEPFGDFDDESFPAADDSYYTGGSFDVSSAIVKLTPLEDDPTVNEQVTGDWSTPKKRKRGRPRKSDSPVVTTPTTGRRGRPPKKKQATDSIVEHSHTPSGRGRGRPKSTPKTAPPKKRKRQIKTMKGQQCDSCGKVVKLSSLLCMHNRLKHNRRTYMHSLHRKLRAWNISSHAIVQRDFESSKNVYGCSRCGEMFNMWTRWRKHYIQRHLQRHKCTHCKASYSYPLDLYHHKHVKHKRKLVLKKRVGLKLPETAGTAGTKRGQQLVSILNLPQEAAEGAKDDWKYLPEQDAMNWLNRKRHLCTECGRLCANESTLRKHLETHKFDREMYKCSLCDRKYSHPRSLQEHIAGVHEGKMHKCTFCEKEYITVRAFEEHLRKHTGEYEFKCEICGKEFVSKRIGLEHQKRHYGLKAFECGLCGNKYSDPFVLNRHLKECGEEVYKTHKCPQCDKWFKNEQYVRNHITRVHKKKTNATSAKCLCSECGKVCSNSGSLKNHMRDQHGIREITNI